MYKKIVKLKIHNPSCDIRENKHGNWTDLCINGSIWFKAPEVINTKVKFYDKKVGLGVSMTLPKHYRAELKPRSSTFKKFGLILSNSIGEIEWDYSLEWQAHFIPYKSVRPKTGESIAQFQISLNPDAPWYMKLADLFCSGYKYEVVDVLTTNRGGWGSSDKIK